MKNSPLPLLILILTTWLTACNLVTRTTPTVAPPMEMPEMPTLVPSPTTTPTRPALLGQLTVRSEGPCVLLEEPEEAQMRIDFPLLVPDPLNLPEELSLSEVVFCEEHTDGKQLGRERPKQPTVTPSPTATPVPPTLPPSPTLTPTPQVIRHIPSPDGRWTAVLNETAGSLALESLAGETVAVFPRGSTVDSVEWSPDSRHLLVVRRNWERSETSQEMQVHGPIELWQVRLVDEEACLEPCRRVGAPELVFESPTEPDESGTLGPEQIELRQQWSPDNRYVLFWHGMLSASVLADGLALWVLDTESGQVTALAETALLNPRYQSWAPDGSALAYTAGGYRSAQINKWLNLYDVASDRVTTVVSQTEQVPGIVAWSPRGDLIAYAAVSADQTGWEWADWMSFENPAIAGRRVYLLDPATGEHWRLNDVEAFQDAPTWSDDGAVLYYVQREGDTMALMAGDLRTGWAQVIEGSQRPAPRAVGYYGQSRWGDLLAYRPDAPRAPMPPLMETYTDPTHGFTLRYPAGWYIGEGWQGLLGWRAMPTLYPPDGPAADFSPFSGQVMIAIQVLDAAEGGLDALLERVLATAGPGQILGRGRVLKAFDRRELTVEGRPAVRLETMGDFGVVNHVLVVLDGERGIVLRGRGDGRVFDAVAKSLRWLDSR